MNDYFKAFFSILFVEFPYIKERRMADIAKTTVINFDEAADT